MLNPFQRRLKPKDFVFRQRGFTLIELLVVVVVLAVVLSAATLAFRPGDGALVNQQVAKLKGALQQTCDQATFEQKVHALIPSAKGLEMLQLVKGKWQASPVAKSMEWQKSIKVSWQANQSIAEKYKLPSAGWICWPSGEILPGLALFSLPESKMELRWTPVLKFESKTLFDAET